MKTSFRKKLIFIIIGVICLFIFFAAYHYIGTPLKIKSEQEKMKAAQTGEIIRDQIFTVSNSFVNFYFIKHNEEYIAIDAGYDPEASLDALKELNINPDDVKFVLLTHSDVDHIATLSLYKNAEVFLPENEEVMINNTINRSFMSKNKLNFPYKTINEEEQLELLGFSIKGIHTPGHTKGSMCYIINDKWLFVGDTLSVKDGEVEIFNRYFNMDTEEQKRSIKKLAGLTGIEYIFTGHYGYHSDFTTLFKKWQ